ncbi:MAG: cytochrome C oxidase subunit IV family protein [Ilumatobacteraceae bacterium]
MTTVDHLLTDEHEHGGHEADAHEEHSDAYYVKVALVLAFITALETSTYWIDFGVLFMPMLLGMMVIKFVMVVSIFMHLKFENKLFSYIFYSGLILAILVYAAALATFLFFSPT